MITKKDVDAAIQEVSKKMPNYAISKTLLEKFTDSAEDKAARASLIGYNKFLPLLIEHFNFKNIIELGSREGGSTVCIYDKLPKDSSFITIDIEKDQRYCPDIMYKDSRVKFIFGDVCDLSIFKESIPMDINLLFTDTIHFDSQLRDEFSVYQHLLADTALVAIDDINLNDKRKLFDEVKYEKWDLTELCHASGWGLFLYERKEHKTTEQRTLDAYKKSAGIWRRKYEVLEKKMNTIKNKEPIQILKRVIKGNKILYTSALFLKGKIL